MNGLLKSKASSERQVLVPDVMPEVVEYFNPPLIRRSGKEGRTMKPLIVEVNVHVEFECRCGTKSSNNQKDNDTLELISCPLSIGAKCGSIRQVDRTGCRFAAANMDTVQVPGIMHQLCVLSVWGICESARHASLGQQDYSNPASSKKG